MSIEKLETSHAHLFAIPDSKKALLVSFLVLLVFSLTSTFLSDGGPFFRVFVYHAASFALLTYTFPLSTYLQLDTSSTALTFKRSMWASIFSSIIGMISYVVALLIATPPFHFFFLFLALGIKIFWDVLVVYTFSFISFLKAAFIGVSGVFFSFLSYAFLHSLFEGFAAYLVVPFLFAALIFTGAVFQVIGFVNFLTEISVNVSGIDLFRGFVLTWLSGKRTFLEKLLTQIAVERELPLAVTVFRSPQYKGVWIVPTIHPGPLLNVGSSDMPTRIGSQIAACLGAPVMFFHGTCSHPENLVQVAEQQKLMKLIIDHIQQGTQGQRAEKISPPVSITHNDVTIFSQLFGNHALFSISRSPLPMDDISFAVGRFLSEAIEEDDFTCTIIDSHNSIDVERKKANQVTLNDPLVQTFLEGMQKAKHTLQTMPEEKKETFVNVGIGSAPTRLSVDQGMGPGGVKVAVFAMHGNTYCYILFDSNNLESGLRESLLEHVENKFGIVEGEVFTSDTHVVNARGSRGGYPLLGSGDKEELFAGVDTALQDALSNMEPCNVFTFNVSNTFQVQGAKSASLLKNFGENSVKIFRFALFISLLPALLGIAILSLLL